MKTEKQLAVELIQLAKLRDDILGSFDSLESDELVSSNTKFMASLESEIELFRKIYAGLSDIEDYSDISFNRRVDGNVVKAPFTRQELEDMFNLWDEDSSVFAIRFNMFKNRPAILRSVSSITNLYNQAKNDITVSEKTVRDIFEHILFVDIDIYRMEEPFVKRALAGTLYPAQVKRHIDAMVLDWQPYDRTVKNKFLAGLGLQPIKEGFTNPYDDLDNVGPLYGVKKDTNESEEPVDDILFDKDEQSDVKIHGISVWNRNVKNKIRVEKGKVFSNIHFHKGDIIEDCPIYRLDGQDVYSKNIRNLAFPIDKENNVYGIPLGYGSIYGASTKDGNVTYEFDGPDAESIRIIALKSIPKNTELIIFAGEDDFENLA